jgi:glycine/D-amino acid oxidase-like deaminating enzyme
LPLARVDPVVLTQALVPALQQAGVIRHCGRVPAPPQRHGNRWQFTLVSSAGEEERLEAGQLVLAAGAFCRQLWPSLPDSLRVSWAGVLQLDQLPEGLRLPPGGALLPYRMQRLELEGRSPQLTAEAWVVDGGLVPWGRGWLAGQISLLRPGLLVGPLPDPQVMESRLRQALATLAPALRSWPGRYCQVPVAFCSDGVPLSGSVPGQPGLWVCSGFSGAFSAVPSAVEVLADRLAEAALGRPVDPGAGASAGLSRGRDRAPRPS